MQLHTYNIVWFAVVIKVVVEVDSFVVNKDLDVWLSLLLDKGKSLKSEAK